MSHNTGASSGNLVLISDQTASASASLLFTGIGSTYDNLKLLFYGVTSSAASANLGLQISYDNGATYKSDANYNLGYMIGNNAAPTVNWAAGQTSGQIVGAFSNAANGQVSGEVTLFNVTASKFPQFVTTGMESGGTQGLFTLGCNYVGSAGAVNAFKILPSSGTFSGTFKLYGVAN